MRSTAELKLLPAIAALKPLTANDAKMLVALTEACRQVDAIETVQSEEQIRFQFQTPGVQFEGNAWLLQNPDGDVPIAAIICVPLPGEDGDIIQIDVTVHPDYRMDGLEDLLFEYAVAHSVNYLQLGARKGKIQAGCRSDRQAKIELFTRFGLAPIRYFHTLERSLSADIDVVPSPEGITIRSLNPIVDFKLLYIALSESFKDHFNPMEFTEEQVMHWISSSEFAPGLSLLAIQCDGDEQADAAGICLNRIRHGFNIANDKKEGEINALGVRREFRRRGIARALLTASMALLREQGLETAILSVDSENPLGATDLYASVGFRQRKTSIVFEYQKPGD